MSKETFFPVDALNFIENINLELNDFQSKQLMRNALSHYTAKTHNWAEFSDKMLAITALREYAVFCKAVAMEKTSYTSADDETIRELTFRVRASAALADQIEAGKVEFKIDLIKLK